MILSDLNLVKFRNYDNLKIKFNPHVNIIYGTNAQGKTNLLESIYILGMTKSHLSNLDDNLIKDQNKCSKIKGIVKNNNLKTKFEIIIEENEKKFKIDNNDIKKVSEYIVSSIDTIIFYPEDLEIIKGTPNNRRNFLNSELSKLSNNYLKILNEYNKLLKIRNDYLKKMSKNIPVDNNYFDIITNYLIDKAFIIYKMRKKFIFKINENCGKIYEEISKLKDFHIQYAPNFIFEEDDTKLKENLIKKYKQSLKKEIKMGTTLYGPHRDEIEFYLSDKNLKTYGSQGQKRLAILSIKLSEIEIFKQFKGTNPILLLDDVFSELDDIKKNNIIKYLTDDIQVFITTTEIKKINKNKFSSVTTFKIKNGEVVKKEEVEENGK